MFSRSIALLGEDSMTCLQSKRVILFGVGGVGSWCAEALIRTGLPHLTIVDDDVVQASNINRQLPATQATIGRPKVEVLRERLLEINPKAEIIALQQRYEPTPSPFLKEGEQNKFDLSNYDYIIDAIDDVAAKTHLIINATRVREAKVFCSMGAALRFDPTQVRVAEFWDVKGDALARALRERMKKLGVKPSKKVKCVYSLEQAKPLPTSPKGKENIKGSLMQVTAVFGCTLASLVVKDIMNGTPRMGTTLDNLS